MMTDHAAGGGSGRAMMSGHMAQHTANDRSFDAPGGERRGRHHGTKQNQTANH
jgi:hypothetical protein